MDYYPQKHSPLHIMIYQMGYEPLTFMCQDKITTVSYGVSLEVFSDASKNSGRGEQPS